MHIVVRKQQLLPVPQGSARTHNVITVRGLFIVDRASIFESVVGGVELLLRGLLQLLLLGERAVVWGHGSLLVAADIPCAHLMSPRGIHGLLCSA